MSSLSLFALYTLSGHGLTSWPAFGCCPLYNSQQPAERLFDAHAKMIFMNTELIQITQTAAEAETAYQEANSRRADAQREITALEDEVAGMTKNPLTSPDKLAKKMTELAARKALLPTLKEVTEQAHRNMIEDYRRSLAAKRVKADALRVEIRNMQLHVKQLESTADMARFNLRRMEDELAAIEALLDGHA